MNTTKESGHKDYFSKFFGLSDLNKYVKKTSKYAKKHFDRFSALAIATTTIGIWIIRALGYAYQTGRLSVYNVDKSYVCLDDNYLLQIIEFISTGILLIGINYFYFFIVTKNDESKYHIRRKLRKLGIFTTEMLIVLIIAIIQTHSSVPGLIKELKSYSIFTWIFLVTILFLSIVSVNMFGIQIARDYNKKDILKNTTKESSDITKNKINHPKNKIASITKAAILSLSLFVILSFCAGVFVENQRTSYKVIEEVVVNDQISNNSIFTLKDNKCYYLYAIVFENVDVYILCRLNKTENGISLDTDYQKIIPKDNIETYNCDNIYKISYLK